MNMLTDIPPNKSKSLTAATALIVGMGAFIFGVMGTFVYGTLRDRQSQIDEMAALLVQMQQQSAADVVSRNVSADLLDVQGIDAQGLAPMPVAAVAPALAMVTLAPAPAPILEEGATAVPVAATAVPAAEVAAPVSIDLVAAPAPVAPAVAVSPEPAVVPVSASEPEVESTADKIRSIVLEGTSTPVIDDETIWRARRLETLAIIDAGVQELVAAVVAGDYDIHTNYEDADFSGRIHFAFVGHEEDQTALERFLAEAAEAGIVAHSTAVVSGDGTVNGHIMLFDLVERALENGTLEEQRAGEQIRASAVAMLAATVDVGEPETAAGEQFYVVEAGDSLAYIALQFYGNTNDYQRIFDANRGLLRTPERIQVGQRLLIPEA